MISGSALSPWAIASDSFVYAKNVAKILGCNDAPSVLDCLRTKSTSEMVSIDLNVPTHLSSFGPIIDGIVIPNHPQTLMKKPDSLFGKYDLILGMTKVESYHLFSMKDEKYGVDVARRDRLLRTLVRNLFNYHLQEIFLTILNEYTDWTRQFFHPISLFDSLVDIFSDALVVAPMVQVGLHHSKLASNTFFYTFMHQTENGDFNPRLGCIHGQDLSYFFGAPLINGHRLSWFSANYTPPEVQLSQEMINFLVNFTKNHYSGNENEQTLAIQTSQQADKEYFEWPPFDEVRQRYLMFGKPMRLVRKCNSHFFLIPDVKLSIVDHYCAHRLSYWFNLLPQLHKPGKSVSEEHHLLNVSQTKDGQMF